MIKRIKKKFLEKRYIFTFLYPFLKECKSFLILLIAETFLIAIISIPIPVINGVCIDVIVQKSSFNRVVSLLVILFILYFAKSILSYVARTGFSKAGIILVRNLKYELVNKITRLPLEYITENGDGYLFARISESDSIKKIISTNTVSVLVSIIEFFFSMVAIFIVNYKLAMCTCICLTLLFVCSRIFLIKIKIRTSELLEENAHTSNLLMDIIGENKLIKIICLFDRQLSLVKKQLEHLKRKQYQLAKKNDQYIETIQMANWLHGVIILAISGYLIFKGEMSIGNYTTYIGYSSKLFGNIMSFSTFSVLLNSIQLSVERLQSFFMVGDEESGVKKISNIYNIEFNNISFAYKGNDIILENFSLQLNKNEPKILCGNNGTGKSTLVNLLLGLYQVKEGNILINGENIAFYEKDGIRSSIFCMAQDIGIFNGTLKENILVNNAKKISSIEVKERLEYFGLYKLLESFDYNLEYTILHKEQKLSGGQCQIIKFLRGVFAECDVIVLDEPTNFLDVERKKLIISYIKEYYLFSKIVVIITHDKELEHEFREFGCRVVKIR